MMEELNPSLYLISIILNLNMWLVATLLNGSALDWLLLGLLSCSFYIWIVPDTCNEQVPLIMFIELVTE